jgi:hypothetical protein
MVFAWMYTVKKKGFTHLHVNTISEPRFKMYFFTSFTAVYTEKSLTKCFTCLSHLDREMCWLWSGLDEDNTVADSDIFVVKTN